MAEYRDVSLAKYAFRLPSSERQLISLAKIASPLRLAHVMRHVLDVFRESGPQTLNTRSVRDFFRNSIQPGSLREIVYPHLHAAKSTLSSVQLQSPLQLARQECRLKRLKLEELRDAKAQALGEIAELRGLMTQSAAQGSLGVFVQRLDNILSNDDVSSRPSVGLDRDMNQVAFETLPATAEQHSQSLSTLRRPSHLTLIWPKLVVIPPITLLIFRAAYSSRENISRSVKDFGDTVLGFWNGWVISPLRDIINTVRAGSGGDDGLRIISKDGLRDFGFSLLNE